MKSKEKRRKIPPANLHAGSPARMLLPGTKVCPSATPLSSAPHPSASSFSPMPCERLSLSFCETYPEAHYKPLSSSSSMPKEAQGNPPPKTAPGSSCPLLILCVHTWGCSLPSSSHLTSECEGRGRRDLLHIPWTTHCLHLTLWGTGLSFLWMRTTFLL